MLIFLSLPGYTYKKENISFILQFQHLFLIPKLDNTQGKKKVTDRIANKFILHATLSQQDVAL